MIIVNQNRKSIVNFDNVNMILVRENKIISFDNTYMDTCDGDLIGTYATEERAKEVLQEITKTYADRNEEIDNSDGRCIYEMPKE